ncbi:MAG TPA: lipid II flippase MurJ [Ktedonobacteraceae bacterium]|jgi:putative peptidoglycan lipid II flippase|nr:lipid II flippase MurJ [Ktedonobacteraceae bacterium]
MPSALSTTSAQLAAIRLKSANKHIFRALLSLASAALLTRVMGMMTQVVVTSRFGAGAAMDAYFVASTFPTTLSYLLIGTVETAMIPVYARIRAQSGREPASALFSTMLNLLLIVLVGLTIIFCIFRQEVVHFSAPALDVERSNQVSYLALFTYPVLVPMVLIGLMECVLNTEGQFGWPAYAGLLVPVTTGVFVFLMGASHGVIALCIGTMVGLCLQIFSFVIRMRRARIIYRPIIRFDHPALIPIACAAWPVFLSSCIGNISPLVDQMFASSLSAGSISSLSYALKLVGVFSGVVFSSLGRAVLPYLSRQAAGNDMKSFKGTLRLYLWGVGFCTLILSMLVLVLAHPIIQFLFQRGAFTPEDTDRTATTLMGFMIGLTPMSLGIVTAKSFSALGRTKMLMWVSIFSVLANALLDAIFAHFWQCQGIALATSAYYLGSMVILFVMLRRLIGPLGLLTVPPEIQNYMQKIYEKPFMRRYREWKREQWTQGFSTILRQWVIRACLSVLVLAAGVFGVIQSSFYTLRLAFGSIVIVLLLRYQFALLVVWVLLSMVLSPNIPFITNNNLLSGMTVPTLLMLTSVPFVQSLQRMRPVFFFLLYLLWIFASIAVIPPDTLNLFLIAWFTRFNYLAMAVIALSLLFTRQRLLILVDLLLFGSSFISFYGIYGYFTHHNGVVDPNTLVFRIFSTFSSAPSLALFLSVVFPLALFRAWTARGWGRVLAAVVAASILLALGMTYTRGAFISVPISFLLVSLLLFSPRVNISLFCGLAALGGGVFFLGQIASIPFLGRFFNQDITTLNGRTYLWQALLDNFDPGQLLGHGYGAADALLRTYRVGMGGGVIATSTSSLYVATLYDHGIVGLALLLLTFLSLIVVAVKEMRHATGERKVLFGVALIAIINVVIQSLDLNDIWNQTIGLYFWLIMALPFVRYWFSE